MKGFFIFCSVLLIFIGVLKIIVAPRPEKKAPGGFLGRPGFINIALMLTVGVLGLLVGLGVIPVGPFRTLPK